MFVLTEPPWEHQGLTAALEASPTLPKTLPEVVLWPFGEERGTRSPQSVSVAVFQLFPP